MLAGPARNNNRWGTGDSRRTVSLLPSVYQGLIFRLGSLSLSCQPLGRFCKPIFFAVLGSRIHVSMALSVRYTGRGAPCKPVYAHIYVYVCICMYIHVYVSIWYYLVRNLMESVKPAVSCPVECNRLLVCVRISCGFRRAACPRAPASRLPALSGVLMLLLLLLLLLLLKPVARSTVLRAGVGRH